MSHLTVLDYGILAAVAFPMIIGLIRGLFRAVFGLLGAVMGFTLGIVFSRPFGDFLMSKLSFFDEPFSARMTAFILIYIGSWLAGVLLGLLFKKLFETLKLGWLDRILGGVFGFFKGSLLVAVIIIIMYITPSLKPILDKSVLGPAIVDTTFFVMSHLPEKWPAYLDPHRWIGTSRKKVFQLFENSKKHKKSSGKRSMPKKPEHTPSPEPTTGSKAKTRQFSAKKI